MKLDDVPARKWLSSETGTLEIVCCCGRNCRSYDRCNIYEAVSEERRSYADNNNGGFTLRETPMWNACRTVYKTRAQAKKAVELRLHLDDLWSAMQAQIKAGA